MFIASSVNLNRHCAQHSQLLLYGLEVCPLTLSDLRSLDFAINRFFMKLFCTNAIDTVKICQDYFNFELPSNIIEKRRKTFVACCVPVS